jgi:hypothetical protein
VSAWGSNLPEKPASSGVPSPLPVRKTVRIKLETAQDCQRALARLIRGTLAGTIQTQDLSRYANALAVLGRLIEGGDIEKRLQALESAEA